MVDAVTKRQLKELKTEFERLRIGRQSLLAMIDEAELPELVYNSNAIENSTLTLPETERILLDLEVARHLSVREVFEAKNLGRVTEYVRGKGSVEIDQATIALLHRMLIGGIDDGIAGRLRRAPNEHVRIGSYLAPPPERVERLLANLLVDYASADDQYVLDRISRFHLEFERIHPFLDGNGRIGRVLINVQLAAHGYPAVIIRNKGKQDHYYPAFRAYQDGRSTKLFDRLLALSVMESLHKRLAYLRGEEIVSLADYGREAGHSAPQLLNAARRQTIPAFRQKGVWKIGRAADAAESLPEVA